jgi:hypothetical protein
VSDTDRPISYQEGYHGLVDIIADMQRRERKMLERLLWALRWIAEVGRYELPDDKQYVKLLIEHYEGHLARLDKHQFIESAIYLGASDEELDALDDS